MVQLGVGKNMVRSIRFWAEAADVLETDGPGHKLSVFGSQLLVGLDDNQPLVDGAATPVRAAAHWLTPSPMMARTASLSLSLVRRRVCEDGIDRLLGVVLLGGDAATGHFPGCLML